MLESRWTILFVTVAALQVLIAVVVEAMIYSGNDLNSVNLASLHNFYNNDTEGPNAGKLPFIFAPSPRIVDQKYDTYSSQFKSITHSNIWFMFFLAFIFGLSISGIFFQNTIEIITLASVSIIFVVSAIVQIIQSDKWLHRINDQALFDMNRTDTLAWVKQNPSQNPFAFVKDQKMPFPWTILYEEFVLGVVLAACATASGYIAYKLYQEFGWKIYKKIGANIQTQARYKTYLMFAVLLKLDIFFLMGFQILNLVFLFAEPSKENMTIIFQSCMVAIVLPMIALAFVGVRSENKPAMIVFAVCAIVTIINLIYILAKFIIQKDEYLLTFLDILGIFLSIASIYFAWITTRNFDKGLKEHFVKTEGDMQNVDLPGIETAQRKPRFSIDD